MRKNKRFINSLIILLLTAACIAAAVLTYLNYVPPAQEAPPEEQVVISYKPDYEIIAGKATSVWSKGQTLEQGRAAYFYAGEPYLKFKPFITISDNGRVELRGSAAVNIKLQAVSDSGKLFWDYSLFEPAVMDFALYRSDVNQDKAIIGRLNEESIDIKSAYDKILEINDEIKHYSALYQLLITTEIEYSGSVNNRPVSGVFKNTLPVTLRNESFTIAATDESSTDIVLNGYYTGVKPEQNILVKLYYANSKYFTIDAVLLLLLIAAIVIRFKPVRVKSESRRFKEWITEGSVNTGNTVNVAVYSLEGLVDLAIDLDKRVIHDLDKKKYYVLDENLAYVFNPEAGRVSFTGDKKPLGKLLLEHGAILPEQLEIGLLHQRKFERRLGESLIELGFIDEIGLFSAIAAQNNIPYVELEPSDVKIDEELLKKMSLNQARALEALPLGLREDGRLVVACVTPYHTGTRDALKEIFKTEIAAVAARPSVIYQLIDKLYDEEEADNNRSVSFASGQDELSSRLTTEEKGRLIDNYKKGSLLTELYLEAAGLAGRNLIARAPEKEPLLQWLTNNSYLDSTLAQLITGIRLAVEGMEQGRRQQLSIPDLKTVLLRANFLTADTAEWVNKEAARRGLGFEKVLVDSYLATNDFVAKAMWLLNVLGKILHQG